MEALHLAIIGDDVVLDEVSSALAGRGQPATRLRGEVEPTSARENTAPLLWVVGTQVGARSGERWLLDARSAGEHTPAVLLRPAGPEGAVLPPRLGVTRPVDADGGAAAVLAAIGAVAATFAPPRTPIVLLPEELATEVARLSLDYGRELPGKLASLEAALELATSDGGPTITRAAVAAARDIAHRLKGTAGSFGYAELGQQMDSLEQVLRGHLDAGHPLDLVHLRAALDTARALVSSPGERT